MVGESKTVAAVSPTLLRERLTDVLSHFDEIEVADQFTNPAELETQPTKGGIDYRLGATLEFDNNDSLAVTFRLLDSERNIVVWSRQFESVRANGQDRLDELTGNVADMLAGLNGVIQASEREKRATSANYDRHYSCLLDGAEFWREYKPAIETKLRQCLERAIAETPEFALGYAYLARLYFRYHFYDPNARAASSPALDHALYLIHRAIGLKPQSARAHEVLMMVLAAKHETAAAIAAGQLAERLNPNSSDIKADVGYWLVSAGQVAEGMALLRDAANHRRLLPNFAEVGLALGTYMGGDFSAALDYLNAVAAPAAAMPMVMRIAVTAELGQMDTARQLVGQLVALQPGWAGNARGELEKLFIAPEIADRVASGLAKAGLRT